MNTLLLSETVYLIDKAETVMPWITVGILLALILGFILTFILKRDLVKRYLKISLTGFTFYALIAGITMLLFEVGKKYSAAYLEDKWIDAKIITHVFIPLIVTLFLVLVAFTVLLIVYNKKRDMFKTILTISGIVVLCALITSLVLISIYFKDAIKPGGYYTSNEAKFNSIMLWASALLLVVATIVIAFFSDKNPSKMDARCMALAGVTTALSFALSYVKFPGLEAILLQGGSVTLFSMLPIMLFAYVYGMKKGLIVGFVYGILQALQDPYIVRGAQFLLDYPIAFAMISYAGLLKNVKALDKIPQLKFALSATLGGSLRYFAHVLSGVFAFGAYAVDAGATNFWTYSLVYNSYVFVDVALVIIAGVILFFSKGFKREIERLNTVNNPVTIND